MDKLEKGNKMKVKIKTWERMESEFGLDTINDIDCKESFNKYMEKSLPEDRIIEIVKDKKYSDDVLYNVYVWYTNTSIITEWNISDNMIEEVIED